MESTIVCRKIVVIGDSMSGKSQLVLRLVGKQFNQQYSPTIGISAEIFTQRKNDILYKFQIWDTSGHEALLEPVKAFFRNSSCVVIVFDLSDSKSCENVFNWVQFVKKFVGLRTKLIICGNKSDICQNLQSLQLIECIQNYCIPFVTASAKNGQNIQELKKCLISQFEQKKYVGVNSKKCNLFSGILAVCLVILIFSFYFYNRHQNGKMLQN